MEKIIIEKLDKIIELLDILVDLEISKKLDRIIEEVELEN